MKTKMLILATLLLTSCQKEENFKPCGSSPIDGNNTWTKKGKCYKWTGVFTWNQYQKVDKSECPCL